MARTLRKFFEAVGIMHRGRVEEEADSELHRLIEAVEQHPDETASGTITLTIKVQKVGDRIDCLPQIDMKPPKKKGFKACTFWIVDGALSVEHPSQQDMFGPRDITRRDTA
ncbi:hypothetical protein [Xanthobacter sp. 91]|uniref:hypothetical protein n=1 Tax=Xanthobacter sp. 91 TaxID=1117244 RepID=UPI0004964679|nr:hypothetical protein [Xanthobacter sp. 91]